MSNFGSFGVWEGDRTVVWSVRVFVNNLVVFGYDLKIQEGNFNLLKQRPLSIIIKSLLQRTQSKQTMTTEQK